MKSDELYKHLEFTNEFSVDDWNDLISIKFKPYFRSNKIFNSNKEVLRTEKINYYFKVIHEILEGVFKPRFRLFDKFINYYTKGTYYDNSKIDFGQIIQNFPDLESVPATLYLKDPYFSITTNQWRNISAHKTFEINKDSISIEYGKKNIKTLSINFEQ